MESMTMFMAQPNTMNMVATGFQMGSTLTKGMAADKAAKYEAEMMRRRATQEYAAATVEAGRRKREADRVISNARAAMAASGGVTTDAGATSQLGELESQKDYNVLSALYEGEQAKQNWEQKAAGRKYEGGVAKSNAISTALSSAFTAFSKKVPDDSWKDYRDRDDDWMGP